MRNYTIERIRRTGTGGLKERLIIKTFKTAAAYGRFMTSPENDPAQWRDSSRGLKAGVYAYAGGQWHNVKTLDYSVLAHI